MTPSAHVRYLAHTMPLRDEVDKLSGLGSAAEVNLVAFVLDGSPSMEDKQTPDGRPKADHLVDIVKAVLQRLHGSAVAPSFRVSFTYFNSQVQTENDKGRVYFTLEEALQRLENPVEFMDRINPRGGTAIADALAEVRTTVLSNFKAADDLPDKRYSTVFLFTDGKENVRRKEDVGVEAGKLKMGGAKIATISFGSDADTELLESIASDLSEKQKMQLEFARVINHLPNPEKMFIDGHAQGKITEEKAQAIRQFLDVLSRTYKEDVN